MYKFLNFIRQFKKIVAIDSWVSIEQQKAFTWRRIIIPCK